VYIYDISHRGRAVCPLCAAAAAGHRAAQGLSPLLAHPGQQRGEPPHQAVRGQASGGPPRAPGTRRRNRPRRCLAEWRRLWGAASYVAGAGTPAVAFAFAAAAIAAAGLLRSGCSTRLLVGPTRCQPVCACVCAWLCVCGCLCLCVRVGEERTTVCVPVCAESVFLTPFRNVAERISITLFTVFALTPASQPSNQLVVYLGSATSQRFSAHSQQTLWLMPARTWRHTRRTPRDTGGLNGCSTRETFPAGRPHLPRGKGPHCRPARG
jgi:hypothetical protein